MLGDYGTNHHPYRKMNSCSGKTLVQIKLISIVYLQIEPVGTEERNHASCNVKITFSELVGRVSRALALKHVAILLAQVQKEA